MNGRSNVKRDFLFSHDLSATCWEFLTGHRVDKYCGSGFSVSTEYLALMKKVAKSSLVMDVLNIPNVQRQLERLADLLNKIQKALGEYLERERASFPRSAAKPLVASLCQFWSHYGVMHMYCCCGQILLRWRRRFVGDHRQQQERTTSAEALQEDVRRSVCHHPG